MDDKLTLETEFDVLGKALLKWFAFYLKFDISMLLTKIGGINGIFFLL